MSGARIVSATLAILLAAGCSGEGKPREEAARPAEATPSLAPAGTGSAGSLVIRPDEVFRGTLLRLEAGGVSIDAGAAEWLVNGTVAGNVPDTGKLRKGDTIQARARSASGYPVSQTVTVRNSPPELRDVRFAPPDRRTGSPLGVAAEGFDADDDPVRFEIRWTRNGELVSEGERLTVPVRGGDRVLVTITPFDGEARGKSATLSRTIRNSVLIEGKDRLEADGNVLSFRILASSSAGTPLIYTLEEAPPGMRIDPATGVVRWETVPGTTGTVPFVVKVSDGAGAETTARFTATVREEDAPGPR